MENIEIFDLKNLRTNDPYLDQLVGKIKTLLERKYKVTIATERSVFKSHFGKKEWVVYNFLVVSHGLISPNRKLLFRLTYDLKVEHKPAGGADFVLESDDKGVLAGIERFISEEIG